MRRVLQVLEQYYPWGAAGLVTFVAYGLPYFTRLPGGLRGTLVSQHMPRLLPDPDRYVLEEAVPGPTDVSPANPGISKLRFQMPVVIEHNDLLFTLRSDNSGFLQDVLAWFGGSNRLHGHPVRSPAWRGLMKFTSSRHMFVQMGLPRLVAERHALPFAEFIRPSVAYVDGLCRPAGEWVRARRHLHVRGQLLGAVDHRPPRRLLRQRVGTAPLPRRPRHAAVFRHGQPVSRSRRCRHVRRTGAVHVPRPADRPGVQEPLRRRRRPGIAAEREPRARITRR